MIRLRRLVTVCLMVALLLSMGGLYRQYRAMQIVGGACAGITPDNWFLWWLYSCDGPSSGGGGSGAGQP